MISIRIEIFFSPTLFEIFVGPRIPLVCTTLDLEGREDLLV